jgi:phage tail sheath gpL-like
MRWLVSIILLTSCSSLKRSHHLDVEFCALIENGSMVNCPISQTTISANDAKRDFVLIRVTDVESMAAAIGACNHDK